MCLSGNDVYHLPMPIRDTKSVSIILMLTVNNYNLSESVNIKLFTLKNAGLKYDIMYGVKMGEAP